MNKSHKESGVKEVYCRYVIRNGKVCYPKKGKLFHFFVKE